MHNFIRIAVLAVVFTGATLEAGAATPDDFYTSLLRRGIAAHDAGRYDDAARQLRIAAFGLVESVEHYQTAQIYLALTYDKVKESDRAREAARRVVAAQRVDAKFAGLSIPAGVRNGFEGIASQLLGPGDLAILRSTTSTRTAPAQQPTTPPAATPTRTATQQPATQQPAAQQPTSTPPQTTTASDMPAPQTTAPATQTPRPAQQQPSSTPTPVRTTPATSTTSSTSTPATSTPATTAPATTAPATKPQQNPPSTTTPATTKPAQTTTKPASPAPASAPRPLTASEITSRIGAAERALGSANLNDARRLYREVLAVSTLDHETLVRVAEGLYRSRDFANSLTAFSRAGTLRKGEEPYRYYIAVALYETGDYARAKKELAAALPFIEVTPDVARYRTKIEGAM